MSGRRARATAAAGRAVAWLRARREGLPWLVVAAVLTTTVWAFLALADEVEEGTLQAFDEAVLRAMREADAPGDPWGPPWLAEAARDYTALGGFPFLSLLTVGVAGFLAFRGQWRFALTIAVSVGGGWLFNTLLKAGYARPRPALVPHLVEVYSASFPSGHAMMAATTYLTLAALLLPLARGARARAFTFSIALVATLLVGTSRVYLGVHWPSDVLAGWAAGAGWALLCAAVALGLRRAGAIEASRRPPGSADDREPGTP